MNRRKFFAGLAGIAVASATQCLGLKEEIVKPLSFDPINYVGEIRWINSSELCPEFDSQWKAELVAAYKPQEVKLGT